jgi:hypothetical protein
MIWQSGNGKTMEIVKSSVVVGSGKGAQGNETTLCFNKMMGTFQYMFARTQTRVSTNFNYGL